MLTDCALSAQGNPSSGKSATGNQVGLVLAKGIVQTQWARHCWFSEALTAGITSKIFTCWMLD